MNTLLLTTKNSTEKALEATLEPNVASPPLHAAVARPQAAQALAAALQDARRGASEYVEGYTAGRGAE